MMHHYLINDISLLTSKKNEHILLGFVFVSVSKLLNCSFYVPPKFMFSVLQRIKKNNMKNSA